MNDSSSDILNTPLENLGFSNEFLNFCKAHEFTYLSELVSLGTRSLESKLGFNKRLLFEYLQLLERHELDEFMDT